MSKTPKRRRVDVPLFRRGYAVFVKLWDLKADSSADVASALIGLLDETLFGLNQGSEETWFPSPYGGAILLENVEDALDAAHKLIETLADKGVEASISIAWGHFERVYNVRRWNVAALALNMAARMANDPELKRRCIVDPKVRKDASLAKHEFRNFFEPVRTGKVKRTTFEYHLVSAPGYSQNQGLVSSVLPTVAKATTADIVAFDIERYSEKSQAEQTRLAEALSRCVEVALSTLEAPINFGPAGDGGFLAFASRNADSAPKAWSFARELKTQAKRQGVPIRIGISNGPVLSSDRRPLIGGAVLRADEVSSLAPSGEIAATSEFWSSLAEELRHSWTENSTSDTTVVVVRSENTKVDQIDSEKRLTDVLQANTGKALSARQTALVEAGSLDGCDLASVTKLAISENRLTSCVWDPSGQMVFVGGFDGALHSLEIGNGKQRTVPLGTSTIRVICSGPVWPYLLIGSDEGRIYAFDTRSSEFSEIANRPSPIYSIAQGSEPHRILFAERDGNVAELELVVPKGWGNKLGPTSAIFANCSPARGRGVRGSLRQYKWLRGLCRRGQQSSHFRHEKWKAENQEVGEELTIRAGTHDCSRARRRWRQ